MSLPVLRQSYQFDNRLFEISKKSPDQIRAFLVCSND